MNKRAFTLPFRLRGPWRELHVSRAARRRYQVGESLFSARGTVLLADPGVAQELAYKINRERDAARFPESAVKAGELYAAGLIDEVMHLLIERYRAQVDAEVTSRALEALAAQLGDERLGVVLRRFATEFPTVEVERRGVSVDDYLAGETDAQANREVVLEELLLLYVANQNPALERFRELFDDTLLASETAYGQVVEGLRRFLEGRPGLGEGAAAESLFDLLRAPALASPTSLEGQLGYIRRHWGVLLGDRFTTVLDRLLKGMDALAEERKPGFAGPPGPAPVLTAEALRGERGRIEYERFSPDSSWMPRVVMLAKSTYVWLDQLSRSYGREISRLDQVPDEELDLYAERGFSALWLIGLWQRSEASRRIKHLRGQSDAVASAYALYDYRLADDLGGEEAYRNLRDRAWQRGIRLASDMVPNHTGIDGRWVVEHPDWFVQLDRPPYPSYSFDGPDLSSDERVGIFLEDHYYDNSDAAVVFKRVDRRSGEERFIYHGNDGTSMPWNDTAQLDYLKPEVREAVIQTILEVARRFPIIRFDAAMTLARQHIQRLWHPPPGHGGAIPSRSQYGSMDEAEFDRAMPEEFWREVVDRVAQEVPDTLLLAEAFWMMEGYFVRTLGMHRVYNSAFMNMLKREANAEFRSLVKNVLEFDPEVLKRFVNFMNNPDEETAVAQFGKGDKYFGVCTVLSTLPGLPMFGHGQVEGFEEKYGMEFRRAQRDEQPDPWLVERHRREIFPLLHRRRQFAEVDHFLFFDLAAADGSVNEDVLAYSNRVGGEASLVVYNNRFAQASGRLHGSAPYLARSGDEKRQLRRTLFEGLGLQGGEDRFVVYRDHGSGLEHLQRSDELRERGIELTLEAYGYRVLLDFREVRASTEEPYGELVEALAGRGVPSIQDAVLDLRLRPVHDAFGDLLDTPAQEVERAPAAFEGLLERLEEFGFEPEVERRSLEEAFAELAACCAAEQEASEEFAGAFELLRVLLLAWMAVEPLGPEALLRFRFASEVASGQHHREEPYDAVLFAEALPLLLEHSQGLEERAEDLVARVLRDPEALSCLRPNEYGGETYFNQEAFRVLFDGLALASAIGRRRDAAESSAPALLRALREIEERSGYRLAGLPGGEDAPLDEADPDPGGGERDALAIEAEEDAADA